MFDKAMALGMVEGGKFKMHPGRQTLSLCHCIKLDGFIRAANPVGIGGYIPPIILIFEFYVVNFTHNKGECTMYTSNLNTYNTWYILIELIRFIQFSLSVKFSSNQTVLVDLITGQIFDVSTSSSGLK